MSNLPKHLHRLESGIEGDTATIGCNHCDNLWPEGTEFEHAVDCSYEAVLYIIAALEKERDEAVKRAEAMAPVVQLLVTAHETGDLELRDGRLYRRQRHPHVEERYLRRFHNQLLEEMSRAASHRGLIGEVTTEGSRDDLDEESSET